MAVGGVSNHHSERSSDMISFIVPAIPVAQPRQRHRVLTAGDRTFAHNYTPAKSPVNDFKATVRMAAQEAFDGAPPFDGAVELTAAFVMPRPKSKIWKTRAMPRENHTSKPDVDNLLKSLKDALSGIAWRDDAQVWRIIASKSVASGSEAPHVLVVILEWP